MIQGSKAWFGGGWLHDGTFYSFHERARPRWDTWRHATPVLEHKFHKAQRTKLKPYEPMKMLSDQKAVRSFGARTSLDAARAREQGRLRHERHAAVPNEEFFLAVIAKAKEVVDSRPQTKHSRPHRPGKDDAVAGTPSVNPARDEVQVAPPRIEPKGEQTIGPAALDASADVVQVTPPPVTEPKGEQTIGPAPLDAAADVVQVTPPPVTELKGEQTIGTAPLAVSADVAQVIAPPDIEHNGASTTSRDDRLLVMMMALVALGIIPLFFRHRYAERVLAYAAMRRSEARADDARTVNLPSPPRNEADSSLVSSLEASVKDVLGTIKEAEAEMVSRQLRRLG
ncbi:hypothetical protein JQ596_16430 [Bradyrhizobium manausense]|uniref:hypothetical protein n=1 Tax=Bradyrhizobium manausense TaxID=989370 RepID=UPI001BAC44A8|nr:hypothetical protein [Bradyrhizobium manausense]MBR0827126.1 hypothetical protein [Bradyrhizobium manausense]